MRARCRTVGIAILEKDVQWQSTDPYRIVTTSDTAEAHVLILLNKLDDSQFWPDGCSDQSCIVLIWYEGDFGPNGWHNMTHCIASGTLSEVNQKWKDLIGTLSFTSLANDSSDEKL